MHTIYLTLINTKFNPAIVDGYLKSNPALIKCNHTVGDWSVFLGASNEELTLMSHDYPVYAIFTDYFGGGGTQGACKFDKGITTPYTSINLALKDLGVLKTDGAVDEFETAGFNKFRTNDDFLKQSSLTPAPADPALSEDEVDYERDLNQRISEAEGIDPPEFLITHSDNGEHAYLTFETGIQTVSDLINTLRQLDPNMPVVAPVSIETQNKSTFILK